jgi:type IV fimbrial biogenesis protein FimT
MKRQAGFTLTEMLVVSAIVAILLAIGVPSYKSISNSYRMSSEANNLLGDLMYARGEAIKEGNGVTVCASSDGATCSGSFSWQNGWLVFSNAANAANPAAGTILRVQNKFTGGTPDTFVAGSGMSAITYNREGFATTAAGFPNTLITLHDPTSNALWTRCLAITPQGLLNVETPLTPTPAGMLPCT